MTPIIYWESVQSHTLYSGFNMVFVILFRIFRPNMLNPTTIQFKIESENKIYPAKSVERQKWNRQSLSFGKHSSSASSHLILWQ